MNALCTFPGKFGDLLWSLPTARALADEMGPVDFLVSEAYGAIAPLVEAQPYIRRVIVDPRWQVQQTAPMTPQRPPSSRLLEGYDAIYHLGYEGWPTRPLPYDIAYRAGVEIDLEDPWITPAPHDHPPGWIPSQTVTGWTDEWFELKVGITELLDPSHRRLLPLGTASPRWSTEYPWTRSIGPLDWIETAFICSRASLFLGDCSALHVLACGLGIPCVIMEPAEARWHDIFWPYGKTGPQVTLVLGGDGKPTFDARHVREALEKALEAHQ